MKKILIFEYITGGGLIGKDFDSNLFNEAKIIINSLVHNNNFNISFFCDYRSSLSSSSTAILINEHNKSFINNVKFINSFDYFLPICPESDLVLYEYVEQLYKKVPNMIISDPETIRLTSDKKEFYSYCSNHNIPNPNNYIKKIKDRKFIMKDRFGCGCNNVKIINKKISYDENKMILNTYIQGESYSVSLFVRKNGYLLISINKHQIIVNNNQIKCESIKVNIHPSFEKNLYEFTDIVLDAFPNLLGYVGFDVIVDNYQIYLIEINARFTTSMTQVANSFDIHPIDYLFNNVINKTGRVSKINL